MPTWGAMLPPATLLVPPLDEFANETKANCVFWGF